MQLPSRKVSEAKKEPVPDLRLDGKTRFPKTLCIVDEKGRHVYRIVKMAAGRYCLQK